MTGNLEVSLSGHSFSNTDSFTLLTATDGINGSFLNVTDGGILLATDGLASFVVSYGSGANADQIIKEAAC